MNIKFGKTWLTLESAYTECIHLDNGEYLTCLLPQILPEQLIMRRMSITSEGILTNLLIDQINIKDFDRLVYAFAYGSSD